MTATKELQTLPTLTRLGKAKFGPAYNIYGITTRLQSPELLSVESTLDNIDIRTNPYLDSAKSGYLVRGVTMSLVTTCIAFGTTYSTPDIGNYLAFRPDLSNTTLLSGLQESLSSDFIFKPKYTRLFKLKVKSIRIDKSLPKIFED